MHRFGHYLLWCFGKSLLFKLNLFLNLLSLNVGHKELPHKVSNNCFMVMSKSNNVLNGISYFFFSYSSHHQGLSSWWLVHSLIHHKVQVVINGSLMNLHDLGVKNIFSLSQGLLSLSLTRLFNFSEFSVNFCNFNHFYDLSFLLESNKFLGQSIHSVGDNVTL